MLRGTAERLLAVRILSVAGLTVTMALSYGLWTGNRYFPDIALLPFSIPVPFDLILPYLFVTLSFLSFIYPAQRRLPAGVLISGILLVLFDLNRLQPWFYQYLAFYAIFLVKERDRQLVLLRLFFAATYLWSGLHKVHPLYFETVAPWFAKVPAELAGGKEFFSWLFRLAPLIEAGTGLLLLLTRFNKVSRILVLLIHLLILWVTGPAGHDYNSSVWPWNVTQMVLVFLLFTPHDETLISSLRTAKSLVTHAAVTLFLLMPALNLGGWWPSWMSFNLYSGNTGYGYVYLGSEAVRFTPVKLREQYLPDVGETFRADIRSWAMKEMNVPPFPERITYVRVMERFRSYIDDPDEAVLYWNPRRPPWSVPEPETL